MPSTRELAFADERGLGVVPSTPPQHSRAEDVVEDLVASPGMAVLAKRPQDSLPCQGAQDRLEVALTHGRVAREVGDPVRDLGSRRGHQVSEHARCRVLLRWRERGQRSLEVILDDPLRPSEAPECCDSKRRGAAFALHLPDPLEYKLEVRRLDSTRGTAVRHRAPPGPAWLDPPGRNLVEHGLLEPGLDRHAHRRPDQRVVSLERAENRHAPRLAVEMVEPERVGEERGDPALEDVELRECVVADAEEDIDVEARARDKLGQQIEETTGTLRRGVVEEELLQLVEQEADLGAQFRAPRRESIGEVSRSVGRLAAESLGYRRPSRFFEPDERIPRPRPVDGDGRRRIAAALPPQRPYDPRTKQRALAHAARAV